MRIHFDIENPFKNIASGWSTSPMKMVILATLALIGFFVFMAIAIMVSVNFF